MRWLACLCVLVGVLSSFGGRGVARAQPPASSASASAGASSAPSSAAAAPSAPAAAAAPPSGPASSAPASSAPAPLPAPLPRSDWCAPELEALAADVCFAHGPAAKSGKRTLVIFLHGLVEQGAGWQHAMQRGMVIAGKRLGFSVLAPRGRAGIGPGRKATTIAWPTAEAARKLEDELIAEWMDARTLVETREGFVFDEVFVLGFSNGAYYASSLALRGRLEVDGYGIFAGGSAPKGSVTAARRVKNRKPVFLAIASKDDTAKKARELGEALSDLSWPHEVASRRVGHVIADAQLERGLEFLRAPPKKAPSKAASAAADKPAASAAKKPTKGKGKAQPKSKPKSGSKAKKPSPKKAPKPPMKQTP